MKAEMVCLCSYDVGMCLSAEVVLHRMWECVYVYNLTYEVCNGM